MRQNKFSAIAQLEQIFHHFNATLFQNRLCLPVHVIQVDKKVVVRYEGKSRHMTIGDKFATATIQQILVEYLHEMVHMYNQVLGVDDCTSQYHNKHFMSAAIGIGLHVVRTKSQGWAITGTTPFQDVKADDYRKPPQESEANLLKAIAALKISERDIETTQKQMRDILKKTKPPKPCFLKYECQCPPPHNSIRSGRRPTGPHAPKITCKVCKCDFVCVEEI